jgi:membrane protease YdiL (CAAX protease family)
LSDEYDDETEDPSPDVETGETITYRASAGDPIFGLLLVGAVSLGLTPLIPDAADFRYTIVWGLLALFGVLAWLIGNGPRIEQEQPENLAWGVALGLILGAPLLAFGGSNLSEATNLMFPDMTTGTILAYIVFVMPLGETLFFRGLLQQNMSFWSNGLVCTAWQMVLFFPLINRGPYPLIVGVVVLMANSMYSYVRERNGLAAAWVCQIVVNVLLIFVPFVT